MSISIWKCIHMRLGNVRDVKIMHEYPTDGCVCLFFSLCVCYNHGLCAMSSLTNVARLLLCCFVVFMLATQHSTAQHTVQNCTVYGTLSHFNSIISVNVCMQPIDIKPVIKSMLWLRLYSMPFHGNFLTQRELY